MDIDFKIKEMMYNIKLIEIKESEMLSRTERDIISGYIKDILWKISYLNENKRHKNFIKELIEQDEKKLRRKINKIGG